MSETDVLGCGAPVASSTTPVTAPAPAVVMSRVVTERL